MLFHVSGSLKHFRLVSLLFVQFEAMGGEFQPAVQPRLSTQHDKRSIVPIMAHQEEPLDQHKSLEGRSADTAYNFSLQPRQ